MDAFARFGLRMQVAKVNGQSGAIMFDAQARVAAVIGLDITDGRIQAIHSIANPDKPRHRCRRGGRGASPQWTRQG